MKVEKIGRNRYAVNSYIVFDEITKNAVIIDPAVNYTQIVDFIQNRNLKPAGILLTHGHIDHIADTIVLKEKYGIDIYIHTKDNEMLMRSELNLAPTFGYGDLHFSSDNLFKDNDLLCFENLKFQVIHTPGHTKGGACFLIENILFTGDTLFNGSIGRTDLYGGNDEHMKASLHKLSLYDKKTVVHPGHGASSTIGAELLDNPFMRNLC